MSTIDGAQATHFFFAIPYGVPNAPADPDPNTAAYAKAIARALKRRIDRNQRVTLFVAGGRVNPRARSVSETEVLVRAVQTELESLGVTRDAVEIIQDHHCLDLRAGMGAAATFARSRQFEKMHVFCDQHRIWRTLALSRAANAQGLDIIFHPVDFDQKNYRLIDFATRITEGLVGIAGNHSAALRWLEWQRRMRKIGRGPSGQWKA